MSPLQMTLGVDLDVLVQAVLERGTHEYNPALHDSLLDPDRFMQVMIFGLGRKEYAAELEKLLATADPNRTTEIAALLSDDEKSELDRKRRSNVPGDPTPREFLYILLTPALFREVAEESENEALDFLDSPDFDAQMERALNEMPEAALLKDFQLKLTPEERAEVENQVKEAERMLNERLPDTR